jgi:adenylyltransferase/sulfurtransferase
MDAGSRYSRQVAFSKVGREGQERLAECRVVVVGIGALGSVIANDLARAGVGHLRLVDRDYVEEGNLQRQVLFTEADAREGRPKAEAAVEYLAAVNSSIAMEPFVTDVNAGNVERIIADADVVVDGSDNFEVRYIINDACQKMRLPWIYGGALMDSGVTMNILPGVGPCFRCLMPDPPAPGSQPTCASAGVLNMISGVIGNIEAAEAIKVVLGSPAIRRTMLALSLWDFTMQEIEIEREPECPSCARGRFDFLESSRGGSYAVSLCGRDAVQVSPPEGTEVDFASIADRLRPIGQVRVGPFMLTFADSTREIRLFKDGRAIITKVRDEASAKSIYSELIGL